MKGSAMLNLNRIVLTVSALSLLAVPLQAQDVHIDVAPVTAHKLPNVPGKSVTLVRVTFPPRSKDGAHRHAGAVTVYVLSGSIKSQIDDGAVTTYNAGDTFFEPPGVTHSMVENPSSTETAEILAVFVADDNATLTTPIK
jgi:quercetin dioxygenase-like cupin family protein